MCGVHFNKATIPKMGNFHAQGPDFVPRWTCPWRDPNREYLGRSGRCAETLEYQDQERKICTEVKTRKNWTRNGRRILFW